MNILTFYPGRFQPFHLGHRHMYGELHNVFSSYGPVYVATSNKVDPVDNKSPFTFDEKCTMIGALGIPQSKIVFARVPYIPREFIEKQKYDPKDTVIIIGISTKDMIVGGQHRFRNFGPNNDGSLNYFQKLENVEHCKPMSKHIYVVTLPTVPFTVLGKDLSSSTELKKIYKDTADMGFRKELIKQMYGKFDEEIYKIFNRELV